MLTADDEENRHNYGFQAGSDYHLDPKGKMILEKVYLSLGANLGDRLNNLARARREISKIKNTRILSFSSIYETLPWGQEKQPDFLNQAAALETALEPMELLAALQAIEIKMGRQKREKWGPREIDIDILLFGNLIIVSEQLIIPHPLLRKRLFVLVPLQELEPELVFPEDGASIEEVLNSVSPRERNEIRKKMASPADTPNH